MTLGYAWRLDGAVPQFAARRVLPDKHLAQDLLDPHGVLAAKADIHRNRGQGLGTHGQAGARGLWVPAGGYGRLEPLTLPVGLLVLVRNGCLDVKRNWNQSKWRVMIDVTTAFYNIPELKQIQNAINSLILNSGMCICFNNSFSLPF